MYPKIKMINDDQCIIVIIQISRGTQACRGHSNREKAWPWCSATGKLSSNFESVIRIKAPREPLPDRSEPIWAKNYLFPPLQSAYRPKHETALMKVFDNANMAADDGTVNLVVLLDFSVAFNTVDHDFDSSRPVWIRQWSRRVVPELPAGLVVCRRGWQDHILNNQTELQFSTGLNSRTVAVCPLRGRVTTGVGATWCFLPRLLTEADKQLGLPDSTTIVASTSVSNLGVQIDENLRMDEQVMMCRRSCYYHMRRIRQVRHLLDSSSLHALVVACVLGRIDYCNSLYAGCKQTVLQGLQWVQSTAARLLTGSGWLKSALPLMRDLHWLPVSSRKQYKLCTLTYNVHAGYCGWLPQGFVSSVWRYCSMIVVPEVWPVI